MTHEEAIEKFGEPLTLGQLMEMDGKPVWTKLLVENTGRKEGWALIYSDDGHTAVQRWTQFPLWYKDYGKTWLAYDYPPVHIERKVWEPCEACFSCHTCTHRNDEYLDSPYCWNCENSNKWKVGVRFCPYCGRPTIDEAWDELEKRLEE